MGLTKISLTGARDTLRQMTQKVNDLIDDLLSTSNGLGASCVGVEDSAANMAAANVEDALAEIYTDVTAPRAFADIYDENSATTTGLTWGYKAGKVRFDNTVVDIAAGTIALTDDATNYIEADTDGAVKRNTTAFTAGRVPLRQVVTSGGAQSTSTDKRAWYSAFKAASTTVRGTVELATDAETITGTDTARACTPANIQAKVASATAKGIVELATSAEAVTGTDDTRAVTPAALTGKIKDEDNMASDSASYLATQQSIKAYSDSATQTLTNKTLTSPVVNTSVSGTAFLDEDNMASDSATKLASQQSIKAYADAAALKSVPSGEKILFYKDTAVTGYTLQNTLDDKVVYVTKGSAAGGETGGGAHSSGTWTQPNHTHTGPSHTHPGPSHSHNIAKSDAAGGDTTVGENVRIASTHNYLYTGELGGSGTNYKALKYTDAGGTGNTGAGGTGATGGSATVNTWRPAAYCFTLQQRN